MNMKWLALAAAAALTAGCVPKNQYLALDAELKTTKADLDKAKGSLAELEALKPQFEQQKAALDKAGKDLEEAKARLSELDAAQKQMEESLKSELDQKTIKLEKMNDQLTVTFVDKILFDSGSAVIKPAGLEALKKVAASLKDLSNHQIHVEGHTDDQKIGSATAKKFPTNWELSSARSTAVVKLLQECGVPADRLYVVGGSMFHPVADNATEVGRSENRRVEIVLSPILKKKTQ